MSDLLHVTVPYARLRETLPLLVEKKLQPEVAFSGPELDSLDTGFLREAGETLRASGIDITVHGPYHDLNPGALEPMVRRVTRKRFGQTLAAASTLGASLVVFHPGFDPWKYGGQDHIWVESNLKFWPPLLDLAADSGCLMALENIFEEVPSTLKELLTRLDSPWLGHCFDVGHWHLFGRVSLAEWFSALGPRLIHLHLHDNFGKRDEHLPVGEGRIDFATLFRLTGELPAEPSLTLEAHDQEAMLRSLSRVSSLLGR
ncbi:MAG: sugar phosphate isomerase/epimerase [Desulfuromonadales bacterium]|jgi:sugar phosphate isomerase/epimerase